MATDNAVLTPMVKGDHAAFGVFYSEHYTPVLRYFQRHTSASSDAEDLTQQLFTDGWQALCNRTSPPPNLRAWLFASARNLLNHWRAQQRPDTPLDDTPADALAEHLINTVDIRLDLKAAIRTLSPIQRQVILLRHVEGFGQQEIADRLGKSRSAVVEIERDALAKLRARLE